MLRSIAICILASWNAECFIIPSGAPRAFVGAPRNSICKATNAVRTNSIFRMAAAGPDRLEEIPEELQEVEVTVTDPETNTKVMCFLDSVAWVANKKYLIAYPVDDCVALAMEEEGGDMVPIPCDDPLMDSVFKIVENDLEAAGEGLKLIRTPITLTMKGLDPPPGMDDDEEDEEDDIIEIQGGGGEAINGSTDDSEGDDVGEDDEEDEEEGFIEDQDSVELIQEFDVDGDKVLLIRYLEPVLLLVKESKGGKGKKYELLPADEDEQVAEVVEQLLTDADEGEFDSDEDEE